MHSLIALDSFRGPRGDLPGERTLRGERPPRNFPEPKWLRSTLDLHVMEVDVTLWSSRKESSCFAQADLVGMEERLLTLVCESDMASFICSPPCMRAECRVLAFASRFRKPSSLRRRVPVLLALIIGSPYSEPRFETLALWPRLAVVALVPNDVLTSPPSCMRAEWTVLPLEHRLRKPSDRRRRRGPPPPSVWGGAGAVIEHSVLAKRLLCVSRKAAHLGDCEPPLDVSRGEFHTSATFPAAGLLPATSPEGERGLVASTVMAARHGRWWQRRKVLRPIMA
mmetsp:Transcript_70085/g.205472  ORF Transcript_70085/g.205472 Transcript_70085/m.205472 type:complete len:281 (-) Transcript_70085:7-849(-)